MQPKNYKDNFFEYHLQGAISSAEEVIPLVKEYVNPVSVIDIGCGVGAWLSVWKKSGVNNVFGVDGEYVDTSKLLIEKQEFRAFNLESRFTSDKKYDLVTSLEVAEHIPDKLAEQYIESLCMLGDIILFSAAIPGQEGTMHINEQYPEYWVSLFHKNKFVPVDCIRSRIWEDKRIQWWYRQNILFFVKTESIANYPELMEKNSGETKTLALVHPELLEIKNKKIAYYEELLNSPLYILKQGVKKIFKKNH